MTPAASSAAANCGERDEASLKTCKAVQYRQLPPDLRKFMAKTGCDVKTGSSYDEGYAVDLNSDGKPEYAFCCYESGHGPCGMAIFGRSSGKWKVLHEMSGVTDDEKACDRFIILKERHSGYNDICLGDEGSVIRFRDGKYQDVVK
jgi:hypothetical protein